MGKKEETKYMNLPCDYYQQQQQQQRQRDKSTYYMW